MQLVALARSDSAALTAKFSGGTSFSSPYAEVSACGQLWPTQNWQRKVEAQAPPVASKNDCYCLRMGGLRRCTHKARKACNASIPNLRAHAKREAPACVLRMRTCIPASFLRMCFCPTAECAVSLSSSSFPLCVFFFSSLL